MFRKPIRKIGPSNRSITGKRPSIKTNTHHQFESSLERDYLTLLEFDSDVAYYTVQPVQINYHHENKIRRYTPDVAVYYKDAFKRKPLLIEIKYEAELIEKKNLLEPKFNAAKVFASGNGYEFKTVCEKDIRTDKLYNIKFLSRYRGSEIEAATVAIIMERFDNGDRLTPQQLLLADDIDINGRILHTLWQLLANYTLNCDMNQKICMNTILWKQ